MNAVCPGYTETDIVGAAVANIVAKTGRSEDEARAELVRRNPQGRLMQPAGSGQHRPVAVPAGQRSDHRPGDFRLGRRGDVRTRKAVRARATAFEQNDLETRVNDQHHQALQLWLRLLACTNKIEGEIRGRLRSEFDTTLPRFDLMAQLERDPEGLKMNELSARLMVTGGNVTGITDQLEKEGLVVRVADPSDRRAYTVKLTPAGRWVFAKMAAVHEQWVVELFAGLNAAEKEQT